MAGKDGIFLGVKTNFEGIKAGIMDVWQDIKKQMRATVGEDSYKNWIAPLDVTTFENGVLTLSAPTNFIGNWVSRTWGDDIRTQFNLAGFHVDHVTFTVGDAAQSSSKTASRSLNSDKNEHLSESSAAFGELASTPLDPDFTFDRFIVGKPNEFAYAAARSVAQSETGDLNPLFLYGRTALGKTHLMNAIAWELKLTRPDTKVMYITAEKFMNQFVRALRLKNTMDFKEIFRSFDVLMVDDVQYMSGKNSTQEEFFHTFNALIERKKQIILTADQAPDEIDGLQERIKSRFQWGLTANVYPTDYELRLGILHSKGEEMLKKNPSIRIEADVYEFVAQRISSHVRALEGALKRLFAFASLTKSHITIDMAQESLSEILRTSERKLTIDEITRKVADHYHIRLTDILGPRRLRAIARPRQIAMYLAKRLTTKSLPDIGRHFGNRDHTTVIHAVKKIEELKRLDHQIAEDVELLRRILES